MGNFVGRCTPIDCTAVASSETQERLAVVVRNRGSSQPVGGARVAAASGAQNLRVPDSVEHDPDSGPRSNQILQFKAGSGSDWIAKKTRPEQIWISKLR